jgi:hypothetical protein
LADVVVLFWRREFEELEGEILGEPGLSGCGKERDGVIAAVVVASFFCWFEGLVLLLGAGESLVLRATRQSELTNEKSRNSSWFIALTIIGSIGVSTGSSDVKSLSKLLVSLSSFC